MDNNISNIIRSANKTTQKLQLPTNILIYGAGNCGKMTHDFLISKGLNVVCFFDEYNCNDIFLENYRILNPFNEDVIECNINTKIIISVNNASNDVADIKNKLERYGYSNIITFHELYHSYSSDLGQIFWLEPLSSYTDKEDVIFKAASIMGDAESKEIFYSILKFRLTSDYSYLLPPSEQTQYFDSTVITVDHKVRFVDCGGYDGDTIESLYNIAGTVESIIAFEPDAINFRKMTIRLSALTNSIADLMLLLPCGVWSETKSVSFDASNSASSSISNDYSNVIQVVALDDVLISYKPSFIKMDIEGAEYNALLGAKKTIEAHKPNLAICVYHRYDHLWEIPLLLASWNLGYKFYMRCYGHSTFETVLYAVQ